MIDFQKDSQKDKILTTENKPRVVTIDIISTKFVAILPNIATNVIFHPFVAILGSIATNLVAIMRVMTTRRVADNGARGVDITWQYRVDDNREDAFHFI